MEDAQGARINLRFSMKALKQMFYASINLFIYFQNSLEGENHGIEDELREEASSGKDFCR